MNPNYYLMVSGSEADLTGTTMTVMHSEAGIEHVFDVVECLEEGQGEQSGDKVYLMQQRSRTKQQ